MYKAEASIGKIYHNLMTWGELQYFSFSTGYNNRLILHQKPESIQITPDNARTIGFRIEDDKYHGWTLNLAHDVFNGAETSETLETVLELRPVINNAEQAPLLTVKEEKIECEVPITVPDVLDTDSDNTVVNKKYLDNIQVVPTTIQTEINNVVNNAVTNVYNTIHTQITSGLKKTFLRSKDTPEWTYSNGSFVNSVFTSIACHHKTGIWCVATNRGNFGISEDDGETFPSLISSRNVTYKQGLDNTSDYFIIIDTDIGWLFFSNKSTTYWYTDSFDIRSEGSYKTAPFIPQSGCYKNGIVFLYSKNQEAISEDNGLTFTVRTIPNFNTSVYTFCCPHPFANELVFFQNGSSYIYTRRVDDVSDITALIAESFNIGSTACVGICCSGEGIYFFYPTESGKIKAFIGYYTDETSLNFVAGSTILPVIYDDYVFICYANNGQARATKMRLVNTRSISYINPTNVSLRTGGYGRTYSYNVLTGTTIGLTSTNKYLLI